MEFDVVQGDTAALSADAPVNAAGTGHRMGPASRGRSGGAAGFELEPGACVVREEIGRFEPRALADVRFVSYATEEHEPV